METRNQETALTDFCLDWNKSQDIDALPGKHTVNIHRLIDSWLRFCLRVLGPLWSVAFHKCNAISIAKSWHLCHPCQPFKNTFTTQPTANVSYLRRTAGVRLLWPPFPWWCCWLQSALLFWTGQASQTDCSSLNLLWLKYIVSFGFSDINCSFLKINNVTTRLLTFLYYYLPWKCKK